MRRIDPVRALAAALCLAAAPAAAQQACNSYDASVAAVQAGDRETAERLYLSVSVDPTCTEEIRAWLARFIARDHFREALDDSRTVEARALSLRRALRYEPHWRTHAQLGQLHWEAEDYSQAAGALQDALDAMAEAPETDQPPEEEYRRIYRLYTAALALADDPLVTAATSGEVFRSVFRNFVVEEVPLPITFEFDSTVFDARGRQFAEALLNHVMTQQPAEITLDGHTDPKGDADYNLQLSVARAEAVADFLRDNGYRGAIRIRGFGESRLPDPPPGIAPGSDRHHQIARRVGFSETR